MPRQHSSAVFATLCSGTQGPAEKVWWPLKPELKNRCFKTLEEVQDAMTEAIEKIITTHSIQQLCSYS
ncbi:MAG: hypothetical protein M3342_03250 [Bacteroidota bacterium]|nr:hypothetical protein [Bacteroidota bacterium]